MHSSLKLRSECRDEQSYWCKSNVSGEWWYLHHLLCSCCKTAKQHTHDKYTVDIKNFCAINPQSALLLDVVSQRAHSLLFCERLRVGLHRLTAIQFIIVTYIYRTTWTKQSISKAAFSWCRVLAMRPKNWSLNNEYIYFTKIDITYPPKFQTLHLKKWKKEF